MKRIARKSLVLIFSLCLLLYLLPAAAAAETQGQEPEFAIVYPSAQESTIAPGRDFYVIGTASTADLQNKSISVELFRKGETSPVRALAHKDTYVAAFDKTAPALDAQYDGGLSAGDIGMPDLMYDTAVPGSETDSHVKIAVTQNNFAALILGGANDAGLTSQGEYLKAGDYTIKVTLADGRFLTKDIVIGDTTDKVICRYSPSSHSDTVSEYVADKNIRMYVDPFPGYWSPGNLEGALLYNGQTMTSDVFLEALPRWRFADSLEYETGNVHLFLYNISPTSASQICEIAAVQRTQRVDTAFKCYYYEYGDPTLRAASGTVESGFKTMESGDKLQFTRAQAGTSSNGDNLFVPDQTITDELDLDFSDGVSTSNGQTLSLFGVTAPIQNTAEQLTSDGKNGYSVTNTISSVRYTFAKDGVQVYQDTRPVGLQREYTDGKLSASLYEFKHTFPMTGDLADGSFTVTAEALDTGGNPVTGGSESFRVSAEKSADADLPFTDVTTSDWFCEDVAYVYENGLMTGTSDTAFSPYLGTTRAMLVTMLWRMEDKPTVAADHEDPFSDVAEGTWYHDAVLWAADNEIVTGYGDGTFAPEKALTREEMAAILYRYEQKYGSGGFRGSWMFLLDYPDRADVSQWADEAMHWCVTNKIIGGTAAGMLDPAGSAQRCQTAAILHRFDTL